MPCGLPDEERLTEDIIALTKDFGRYGYRMITGMFNNSGWHVNHKRPSCGLRANHCRAVVERIWRREGLKVPQKQPKKGWLWLNTSRDHALHDPAGQLMGQRLNFCRFGLSVARKYMLACVKGTLDIWQAQDAMPLKTPMQCRSCQLLGISLRDTLSAKGCGTDGWRA